jgi:hypothetical protein
VEQSSQETSINDLFVPDSAPVTQTVAPSNAPVEQVPAEVAAPVVEAPKPTPAQTVPLPELLEQRHARQMAEREAQYLREQLTQYQRSIEAQRPQPQPIDPVADPEGAFRALQYQMQEQAIHQRANTSEMMARNNPVYGAKVDEAVAEAVKAKLNGHFMQQPDPYRALMDWHTSRSVAQQVGPDLNAYREKLRAEIVAEMRAGVRPTAPQNLPPSLSQATNANNSMPVVKDSSDFFKEMLAKPRA